MVPAYTIRPLPAIMTNEQVMEELHCSRETLDNLVGIPLDKGGLEAVRIGKHRRFLGTSVIAWIEARPSSRHKNKGAGQPQNFRPRPAGARQREGAGA